MRLSENGVPCVPQGWWFQYDPFDGWDGWGHQCGHPHVLLPLLISTEGENLTACHVNLCSPVDFKGPGNDEQSLILAFNRTAQCFVNSPVGYRLSLVKGTNCLCSFAAPVATRGIDENAKEQSKFCSQCPTLCAQLCFKLSQVRSLLLGTQRQG